MQDAPCQWENDMAADPWKTDFYYEELPTFSEDCLYLNIATTAVTGDEKMLSMYGSTAAD